jgi:tetratricopeptide (TPR) repeat protein
MPSIRELRDARRRQSFTGREVELNTFRQLLMSEEPEYAILQIYGVGGVGKSTLLGQYRRISQRLGYPVARVDLQVNFGVIEILRTLRAQFEGRFFSSFDRALSTYNQVEGRIQSTAGSLSNGILSGLREGIPFGLGAVAVDTVGEERFKNWLYQHLPQSNAELYLHADRVLTSRFIEGLNALVHKAGKAVILFDTYELGSQSQDAWLRDIFLDSDLSSNVLLVIAGRDRLTDMWREWFSVLLVMELCPFTAAEAREFLKKRGLTSPSLVEAVLTATGRFPWSLALITDTSAARDINLVDIEDTATVHNLGDMLVDRFLSQVNDDAEMRDLVYLCAVPRNFDHDVIRALWGKNDVTGAMDRLRRFSFVQVRDDGRWSIHSVVRQAINRRLKSNTPLHWEELNRDAAIFYRQRSETWPLYTDEWRWLTLESFYHRIQVREDEGIQLFSNLFESAKRFLHYDFCSELLSTLDEIQFKQPSSQLWVEYYVGKMARLANSAAWEQAHQINKNLYALPNLDPALEARVANDLGRYYYHIACQYTEAVSMLEKALELRRRVEGDLGEAYVLSHLAPAYAAAGMQERAIQAGQRCVTLSIEIKDSYREGWGHYSLGESESRAGNWDKSLLHLERAAGIFQFLDAEFELGVVLRRIGRAQMQLGHWDQALANYQANLALMRKYDKYAWAIRALVDISELYLFSGKLDKLPGVLREAITLLERYSYEVQRARLNIVQAEMALQQGEIVQAAGCYFQAMLALALSTGCIKEEIILRFNGRLSEMTNRGEGTLAKSIIDRVHGDIELALNGALEHDGNLITLNEQALERLRAILIEIDKVY